MEGDSGRVASAGAGDPDGLDANTGAVVCGGRMRASRFWAFSAEMRTAGGRAKLVPTPGYISARDPANADARMGSALTIDLLRQYIAGTTVEAEADAERQRAERERLAEERQRTMAQAREGLIQPH